MRKIAHISLAFFLFYCIGLLAYVNSDQVFLFTDRDKDGTRHKVYMVRDWPRSSLVLCILYLPALWTIGGFNGNIYIQGFQTKVQKSYWNNFVILISGKPAWWN